MRSADWLIWNSHEPQAPLVTSKEATWNAICIDLQWWQWQTNQFTKDPQTLLKASFPQNSKTFISSTSALQSPGFLEKAKSSGEVSSKEPWHCLELLPQGCVPPLGTAFGLSLCVFGRWFSFEALILVLLLVDFSMSFPHIWIKYDVYIAYTVHCWMFVVCHWLLMLFLVGQTGWSTSCQRGFHDWLRWWSFVLAKANVSMTQYKTLWVYMNSPEQQTKT